MLYCDTEGKGQPVLLIHAFPLSSRMWEAEIETLSRNYQVIIPDLPGFGRSPRQKEPSIPEMARETAALLDHLGVKEPVFIGGLSMGGYVAFEFLRQFPKRVSALGLFSTRAAADTPEGREKRMKAVESIKAEGLEVFSRTVIPNLLGRSTIARKNDVTGKVREMLLSNKREGIMDGLKGMAGRNDSTDLLPKITCPVLIIAGDEDTFIPVSEAEAMHKKIPQSEYHVISGAGHLVNLEQPAAFGPFLENFLSASFAKARK